MVKKDKPLNITHVIQHTTVCHAGQRPRLSRRTDTTTRFRPKAARHRGRQGVANIRSVRGLSPRKHSPDGATAHIRLNGPASHLSTSEG